VAEDHILTASRYLLSTLISNVTGRCDIYSLRALNCFTICAIVFISYKIVNGFKASQEPEEGKPESDVADPTNTVDAHVAANIGLFPPLFFFSALYYTDLVSTAVVLLHYHLLLRSLRKGFIDGVTGVLLVILGLVALLFRQTNIFWVAVFPAGLSVLNYFDTSKQNQSGARSLTYTNIMQRSWEKSELFSMPIYEASLEGEADPYHHTYQRRTHSNDIDYFMFLCSLAAVMLRNPITVVRLTAPYLILLVAFGVFVLWNGSVVLGMDVEVT
jgi:alpha-1,2-glucosyltransferase